MQAPYSNTNDSFRTIDDIINFYSKARQAEDPARAPDQAAADQGVTDKTDSRKAEARNRTSK